MIVLHCTGLRGIEHSPGVSLNTNFHLTGQTNSLLDDSESSSADEEEVIELMLRSKFCTEMPFERCILTSDSVQHFGSSPMAFALMIMTNEGHQH